MKLRKKAAGTVQYSTLDISLQWTDEIAGFFPQGYLFCREDVIR